MQRNWITIGAVLLATWPAALATQQPPRPPRPPRPTRFRAYAIDEHRGRIGVIIRTDASPETDKIGAKIEGVTPAGPADKAGVKVGDIITKFNGTTLAGTAAEEASQSGPGAKLIELAHQLTPGDTVAVEYRRGTETKKATIVAEDGGRMNFAFGELPMPPMAAMPEFRVFPRHEGMPFCVGESWCDLDLVTLNPDLGEYFGVKEGVLVVKAPGDSTLPLRSGDVILAVGGRKPTSPSHAMRILRSYEKGETVSIDLMRKQKHLTLSWKVPPAPGDTQRVRLGHERDEPSAWRGRSVRARLRLVRV